MKNIVSWESAIYLLLVLSSCHQNDLTSNQINRTFLVTSHRGFSGQYPENTLLAIEKALDLEAERVEVDVQQRVVVLLKILLIQN